MKVKDPLHSDGATGKFDGGIIFEKTRGLFIAKRMKRPPNPQSNSQTLTRNRLSILSRAWGDLTQVQRDAWDAAAPGLATGYNNYVGLGIKALEMDETPVGDPPVTSNPNDILDPELRTGSLGELIIIWNPASEGDNIEVRSTGAIPDGRNPKDNEYRVRAFVPVAAGTYTLTGLPPSSRLGVRLRPLRDNGQAGNTWEEVGFAGDPLFVGYIPFAQNKSIMVKMDLVDFRRLRTVDYGPGVKFLFGPAVSPNGDFVYCFDIVAHPSVYKIGCNDLQINDSYAVPFASEFSGYNVVDNSDNFLYIGGFVNPPAVAKLDLNTKLIDSTVLLPAGDPKIVSLRIGGGPGGGDFLYGVRGNTIFRIDLSTFTLGTETILSPGAGPVRGLVLDEVGGFAYVSGGGNSPKIFKVELTNLTQIAFIDVTGSINEMVQGEGPLDGFIYFSSFGSPGEVGRFRLSDFTFQGKVTGQPGENFWQPLLLDTARKNLFVINFKDPAKLIQISTSPFQRVAGLSFAAGEDDVTEMAGFLSP